jgi:hypothetical protein
MMPEAGNHALPGATNDTWRTWLMTGARRGPVDRRRMRGAHKGLKKMLVEGMTNGGERPHAWKDFSGAMIRHAVEEAMRTLPPQDKQVVKLAYFGGLSNRAIAEEVGLTEGTVQRRLRRALATISEHIQHGRMLGRRAAYAVAIWVSGRWLTDGAHHAVQAVAVAAVTAIIVTQAAPSARPAAPVTVIPPVPSPTIPAAMPTSPQHVVRVPDVHAPAPKLPVALPSVLPLPPLPVKVKLPT